MIAAERSRSRRRLPRLRAAGVVVTATLTGSMVGASTASAADAAATVNGVAISSDLLLEVVGAGPSDDPIATQPELIDGETARQGLTRLILVAGLEQFLDSPLYSAGDPASADDSVPGDWATPPAPPEAAPAEGVGPSASQELGNRLSGQIDAMALAALPADDVLGSLYDERPASTGIVCLTATGVDVRCLPLLDGEAIRGEFGDDAQARLTDARPGTAFASVDSGDGATIDWTIASWDEAADAFKATYEPFAAQGTGGQVLFFGFIVTSDVSVDLRWGLWDPWTVSVVALASQ